MELRFQACHRAVQFVSLELDGELSALERAILRRHLQRCERCAVYAQRVTSATEMLQSAPLEQFHVPVDVWRPRRRVSWAIPGVAAAAAAAAVVGIGLALGSSGSAPRPTRPVVSARMANRGSDDRFNWSAGLPRAVPVVELFPGGLYTPEFES